ncbi:hypothetical protein CerSpe_212710 [Prunus speciosa]
MMMMKSMMLVKPAEILSDVKADKTIVSQLTTTRLAFQQKNTRRLVASYTTDVAPPPPPQSSALRRSVSKRTKTLGNPCLDLYFRVLPNTRAPYKYLDQLLPLAWSHDSLTTLKLICNLRDDYDLGKSYLQAFYRAALWLHHNHPKTLACNADTIVSEFSESVGTMDDLVEILYRLSKKDKNNTIAMANGDTDYRFLHDRVSDIFADYLREDIQNLEKQQEEILSSAAFFCPPVGSSLDRATLLCESIARKVFPIESQGLQEAHYADRVRDRLSKEVLVPLAEFLISEGSQGRGCPIKKYLEDLKASKIELEAEALLPHEIIGYANDGDVGQAAELQWKAMVEEVYLKQGKFSNCLVACNVSSGLFKNVSVALAVLVSQLGEEPWKGKVINFSPEPELHNLGDDIDNDALMSKCASVGRMVCGREIDFRKVFDMILQVAVDGNLRPDQMVKKVFVLTPHENFDWAGGSCWESDYEAIQSNFKEKGYGDAVPQIVFWQLDHYDRVPVPCRRRPGVATLGGFSSNLFKSFLDKDGEVGPHHVMEAAICGPQYQNLAVVD